MLRISALKLIITVFLSALILSNPPVIAKQSAEHFSVYTDKKEYVTGETVNIYVITNVIELHKAIKVTDVIVYDCENNPIAGWHHLSILLTDTTASVLLGSVIAKTEGEHTVHAKAIEFYDLNSDGTADAEDICIIAFAHGSYPEHPRWNELADINKDNIVDIKDVYLVMHQPTHVVASCEFTSQIINPKVIPEVPIGTIFAAMTFLVATGFYMVRKRKNHVF